jgi:UDP-N-acetylmuramate: L-alanyl-gamma-D-glutamyl-meso-diaminopimelate ligase
VVNGTTNLIDGNQNIPLKIFGLHNLQNLKAAQQVCKELGIDKHRFYNSIKKFRGASNRLELVVQNNTSVFYKDFAHSPSKLKATTKALKEQFPKRKLVACMELHTFSSLNKDFLKQYKSSMCLADEAIVYFNTETIKHKKLEKITEEDVSCAFVNITVFTSSDQMISHLNSKSWDHTNLLMMSSGNFDGIDFKKFGKEIIK